MPIEDALLTWSSVDLESALPILATTAERRIAAANASRSTHSDPEGFFAFESAPDEAGAASVLWATAIGMEGNAVRIENPSTRPIEVRLSSGTKRDVRVVDASGSPVAGAQVEQFCFGALDRAYSDPWKAAAAQAFRRLATTDAAGRPVPAFFSANGGERLRASHAGVASDTWREPLIEGGKTIELVLSPAFTCHGVVSCADNSIDLSRLVVDAWALGDPGTGSLAVAEVRADGSWGPLDVPCRKGWEYGLSLDGPGIASDVVLVGRLSPGDSLRQDFEAVPELVVPVEVVDDAGAAVAGALLMAQWMTGNYGATSQGSTDAEGIAALRGVRPGWVRLSASADGFTDYAGEWTELAPPLEGPVRLQLAPSRRVRGRVLHEGEPVERFRVVWWTAQSILSSQSWEVDFADCKDGHFELESAPRETVWLMASAEGFSRSGFARAEVESEEDIVLELMPSSRAVGRVVDALTLEPIPGSSVLLYMNRGNQYLQPRGAPVVVDAQGRFELDGLAPGDNRLVFEAPGYSRYLGVAFGAPGRDADVGAIAMQRTRELALVLVAEGALDPSGFTAKLKGTRYHGPIGFGADGVARFEDVSPGIATWEVNGPGGFLRREIHTLQSDVEWIFEVDVDGGPPLDIQIISPSGGQVPRGIELTVFGAAPPGLNVPGMEAVVRATADNEGRARVRGLRPGPVAVEAVSPDGTAGAAAHGVLEPEGTRLEILWSYREHTFRVLDEAGRGLSEVDVFLFTPEGGATWNTMGATDSLGEVSFYLFPYDDVLVGAKHPELGMLPARPVRLSEEGGTTTLRYGATSGLDVLLLEDGTPSAGTQASLFTGGFRFVVGDVASDGEGRLRWPNLAEGTYALRIVHPGFWPGHAQVPTASGGEPTPVTIYRTGSAVLRLVAGASAPLAGQALELEHVGLGEGPAQWAALGLLPSAATVSDDQGRIGLAGWPRGAYRWRAERPDGAVASGELELAPGANPEIELRIP